ncbi:MAG: hypothetical protein ACOCQQ_01970 [Candidatus Nanoarchaeia archaeon]
MSKNTSKATNDLQSRIHKENIPSQWELQINETSGLSYDYLNELHSRVFILKTKNEEFYSHLQQPLPSYISYCDSKKYGDYLLQSAKTEALKLHTSFVKKFNKEDFQAKKSLEVVFSYLNSFSNIISGKYSSFK